MYLIAALILASAATTAALSHAFHTRRLRRLVVAAYTAGTHHNRR